MGVAGTSLTCPAFIASTEGIRPKRSNSEALDTTGSFCMLRVIARSAVPSKLLSIGNRIGHGNSPSNGCDLATLDVIRNKLHFRRVTLDIDIVIACADATVAQLLALYDQIRVVPMIGPGEP